MNGWMGCLLGIVIGGGGCLVWLRNKGPDVELLVARQQLVELTRERANADGNCSRVVGQLAVLVNVNQELNRRLKESQLTSTTPASSGAAPPSLVAPPPLMDPSRVQAFRAQQFKDEAERLKRRLRLTAEQGQKLDRVLSEGLNAEVESRYFNLVSAPWFNDALSTLLTPEQKTRYETIQEKDRQNNTEMSARFELNQLEQAVDITDAQRQVLLPKFMERARTLIDSTPPAVSENGVIPDPLELMQVQLDRKLEAVDSILTAPQLDEYRKYLTIQLESLSAMVKVHARDAGPPLAIPSQ